jgi:hypothetical protein
MVNNFQVYLTATAESDYERICDEPNQGLIVSVDKAIDETLASSPLNPALTLAGALAFIFMLNLGPVCIYYLAYPERGSTFILHIGDNQEGADLSWLHDALKNGEQKAEILLEQLGIEPSYVLDEGLGKPWVN